MLVAVHHVIACVHNPLYNKSHSILSSELLGDVLAMLMRLGQRIASRFRIRGHLCVSFDGQNTLGEQVADKRCRRFNLLCQGGVYPVSRLGHGSGSRDVPEAPAPISRSASMARRSQWASAWVQLVKADASGLARRIERGIHAL